jgi:DNA-binding CsgD family transcriptional regulator
MHGQHWTPEEDEYLLAWAGKKPTSEIAADLDRTIDSIKNRVRIHKVRLGFQWKQDELTILESAGHSARTKEIASRLDRSIHSIRRKRRALGLTPDADTFRRQYQINDATFNAWSEETAYWIGFIAADGSMRRSSKQKTNGIALQLAEKDVEHLIRLRSFLNAEHPVIVNNSKAIFVFSSANIFHRLVDIGITPNKTATLTFPSTIPHTLKHHFVRGYFDGDGSVGKGVDNCPFFNLLGTEAFLQSVSTILPVVAKVYKRADCNIYRIQLWGEKARQTFCWMYQDATVFLPRKWERAREYLT